MNTSRLSLLLIGLLLSSCSLTGGQELRSHHCEIKKLAVRDGVLGETLALHACPASEMVTMGERIEVVVAIRNISDTTIAVRPQLAFGSWLHADVVGPTGDPLSPQLSGHPPEQVQEVVLEPGGFVGTTVDIRCPFPLEDAEGCIPMYDFNEEGRYRVQMHYSFANAESDLRSVSARPFEIEVGHN